MQEKRPAEAFLPSKLLLTFAAQRQHLLPFSGQVIEIAGAIGVLLRRNRRNLPGHIHQVEKLRHIYLGRVPIRERREIEAGFDELEDRGVVGDGMGNVVLLRERRDHNQGNAVPRVREIASWTS
jgi:hypothetical protein